MTRNDYEVLADVFAGLVKDPEVDWISVNQISGVVIRLCERFKLSNPRFSAEKFVRACGLGDITAN